MPPRPGQTRLPPCYSWRVLRSPFRWLRDLWRHLRSEHTSSGRLTAAVALGLFIGTLPLYGLHLPICVAVSLVFGLNKITTYLAANVSNPLMAPFLVFGGVQLGERVLRGRFLALSVEDLERVGPGRFFASWWLGSVLLGLALALVGGVVTWASTTRRRRRERAERAADPYLQAVQSVARRYLPLGRFAHGYVRSKLVSDPVYRALVPRIPAAARVLDVGAGRGQLALLLAALGPARAVSGLDWDAAKVALAARAGQGLPGVSFAVADLRTADLAGPPVDVVLLLDVLHYLPVEAQDRVLRALAARLAPGGTLFLRDADAALGWRFRVTAIEERLFTGLGVNRGAGLYFRPIAEIARLLEAEGLAVRTEPMWEGTPFANVLVAAERPKPRNL